MQARTAQLQHTPRFPANPASGFGKRKRSESSLGLHAGHTSTAEPTLADSRRHEPVMCNESMQPGGTQAESQSELGVVDLEACRQSLLGLGPEDLRGRLEAGSQKSLRQAAKAFRVSRYAEGRGKRPDKPKSVMVEDILRAVANEKCAPDAAAGSAELRCRYDAAVWGKPSDAHSVSCDRKLEPDLGVEWDLAKCRELFVSLTEEVLRSRLQQCVWRGGRGGKPIADDWLREAAAAMSIATKIPRPSNKHKSKQALLMKS